MKMNILDLEDTIDNTIKELGNLRGRNDIESVEINIRKYRLDDKYDTNFEVSYNIGEVENG